MPLELYRIHDQLREVSGILTNSEIPKLPSVQSLCVDAFSRCVNLAVYLLAVIQSALPEIFRRAGRNKTNWNFGLFKLGADIRDLELQENTLIE